ncbi:MAG: hypothetical protein KDC02_22135, partial [Flavobacteriales bacterium]|nr:hypothetical protein [Flavobacteriales bacterium]
RPRTTCRGDRTMAKVKGILLVAMVLGFIVITWISATKDSRALILETFTRADRIELKDVSTKRIYPADEDLRQLLLSVLGSLEVTRHPARQSCGSIDVLARTADGQVAGTLRIATTQPFHGFLAMAGERNYASAAMPDFLRELAGRHPEISVRYRDEEGRCQ